MSPLLTVVSVCEALTVLLLRWVSCLEFAKYTVRLDCNDWNAEFVPAMEVPEENARLDAEGGYGGRVRLPWRLFLSSESV